MSEKLKALQGDMLAAMKAGDKERKGLLSMLISRIKLVAKNDGNRDPVDADVLTTVPKMIKETNETRDALIQGGRSTDKVDAEIAILGEYLPKQMTDDELEQKIEAILGDGDRSKKAMGRIMAGLNAEYLGQFDPKRANQIASRMLG